MTNIQTNYVPNSLSIVDISNTFFFDKTLDSFTTTDSESLGLKVDLPQIRLAFQLDITIFQKLDHEFLFIDNYLHNIPPPHSHS